MLSKSLQSLLFAGTLLLNSSCLTYKTIPQDSISTVKPTENLVESEINSIDYSKLTWQKAIEYVQTPEQAQNYLDTHFKQQDDGRLKRYIPGLINFGKEKGETFKYNHFKKKGTCVDYATAAAALLSDNNFPPLIIGMRGSSRAHAIFLYKTDQGFSALGVTPMMQSYSSVENLIKGFEEHWGYKFEKSYSIINLDDNFPNREWIYGDLDLAKKIPHFTKKK